MVTRSSKKLTVLPPWQISASRRRFEEAQSHVTSFYIAYACHPQYATGTSSALTSARHTAIYDQI
jgi:hypothetical protein